MALYPPPSSGGSTGSTTAATAATAVQATYIGVGHNASNQNVMYTVPNGKRLYILELYKIIFFGLMSDI